MGDTQMTTTGTIIADQGGHPMGPASIRIESITFTDDPRRDPCYIVEATVDGQPATYTFQTPEMRGAYHEAQLRHSHITLDEAAQIGAIALIRHEYW